jgi:hypothetical protein
MAFTNQIIDLYQGDSQVEFVDLDTALGTPFDASVAGIEIEWRMMTSPHGDTLIRKALSEGGIAAVTGGVNINLTPTDTNVRARNYYHAMRVFDALDGDVTTVMTGTVVVRRAPVMGPMESPSSSSVKLTGAPPIVTH